MTFCFPFAPDTFLLPFLREPLVECFNRPRDSQLAVLDFLSKVRDLVADLDRSCCLTGSSASFNEAVPLRATSASSLELCRTRRPHLNEQKKTLFSVKSLWPNFFLGKGRWIAEEGIYNNDAF